MDQREAIERAIFDLLAQRGARKTICPSEAARRVRPADWRPLMEATRRVATDLADAGRLEVTQRGQVVDPRKAKGPIRLRLAER
ncbi:DUF3253 domain-containing protein [Botrimarina sp.]|uniref:DUF3253 domain-containing protein n=1 Tax=Botrimarina sp. TaxID=2795802 RepID=UPI0032EF24B7